MWTAWGYRGKWLLPGHRTQNYASNGGPDVYCLYTNAPVSYPRGQREVVLIVCYHNKHIPCAIASTRGADEARLLSTYFEILVAEIDRRATVK